MCTSEQRYKIIKWSWKKKSIILYVMEWLDFLSTELLGMCDKMKASQPKIRVKEFDWRLIGVMWEEGAHYNIFTMSLNGILDMKPSCNQPALSHMIEQPQCHHVSKLKKKDSEIFHYSFGIWFLQISGRNTWIQPSTSLKRKHHVCYFYFF